MDDELRDEEFPDELDWDDEDDPAADQVTCPACGEWVYDDAEQCPHCGNWIVPAPRSPAWKRRVWWAAAALVVAALILMTVW